MREKLEERFFELLDMKLVHSDFVQTNTIRDGLPTIILQERRLLEIEDDLAEGGKIRCIEFECPSTGRKYMHCVPPTIATCQEAVAWMWDLPGAEYRPEVET